MQLADGAYVVLRGQVVRPKYTAAGLLDACLYRGILTILIRRVQVRTAPAAGLVSGAASQHAA